MSPLPRPKAWRYSKLIAEYAFDGPRLLDCTSGKFDIPLQQAEIIEQSVTEAGSLNELVLVIEWKSPLHVVVLVDDLHREERVITVYEPQSWPVVAGLP